MVDFYNQGAQILPRKKLIALGISGPRMVSALPFEWTLSESCIPLDFGVPPFKTIPGRFPWMISDGKLLLKQGFLWVWAMGQALVTLVPTSINKYVVVRREAAVGSYDRRPA